MASMTEEQWQAVYDAAYAASDAWQKERKDLIAERDRALKELAECKASKDYLRSLHDRRYGALKASTEDLIRSSESLRASHQKSTEDRDYWKAQYEKLKIEGSKLNVDPYKRLDQLEKFVREHIDNLQMRVLKIEGSK